MTALLALDQGTSSTRSIVFDLNGKILSVAQEELTQHYPENGWVEHDAEEIWQTQIRTAQQAIQSAQQPIAAIGITNQRETVVLWDRQSGKPIHRAIVWQDRRTSQWCQDLRNQGQEELVRQKTGLVLDPYFSASKIKWLLDNVEGARKAAEQGLLACGTIDTWLLYNLSGGQCHATDVSNASRTSLMNINTGNWDDELLQIFDIPRSLLPEIKSSAEVFYTTDMFGSPLPIAGIAGDQQAALFGQRCINPGMVKCTYGTGAFIMSQCGEERKDVNGLLSTLAWRIGSEPMHYALEGSVFSAGSSVQWLRDELGIINKASDIETLATQVDSSEDVYFIPAFTGLGTPYWDPHARGLIVGLTRNSNKSHIARACLEGIAHQVCDVVDAMRQAQSIDRLQVDGGASANNLLLKLQADLGDLEIHRPQQIETTALGAAWLAAIGAGICSESDLQLNDDLQVHSRIDQSQRQVLRSRWDQAVQRALNWAADDS